MWLLELSDRDAIVISPQVVNEFTSVLAQKLKMFSFAEVEAMTAELEPWCSAPLTFETSLLAFDVQRRFGLSWWDSLIVASALSADCAMLLTEDLQHGQNIGPLRIVNPFLVRPDEILPSF